MINKIVKILLLAAGVALMALAVKGLTDIPKQKAVLGNAVYLDQPVVLPENEGKMVIVHGMPEMVAPVYDEELKLTIDSIKAYRYKEVYKQTGFTEEEKKWEWTPAGQITLTGEARIGEFELDGTILTAFPADGHYVDFDPVETADYVLSYKTLGAKEVFVLPDGGYYAQTQITGVQDSYISWIGTHLAAERLTGATAYNYRFYDPEKNGEMTVAGIQTGGRLVADEATGAIVRSGVVTAEKLTDSNTMSLAAGSGAFLLLGAALCLLALRKPKKATKGKEG